MGPVVKPRGIGAGGPPLDRLVRAAAAEEARASPPHPPRKRGSRGCCFVRVWRRQGRSMDPRLHGDERPWRARLPPRLMVSGDEPCGGQWRTVLYHPPSSLDFARDEGSWGAAVGCMVRKRYAPRGGQVHIGLWPPCTLRADRRVSAPPQSILPVRLTPLPPAPPAVPGARPCAGPGGCVARRACARAGAGAGGSR